MNFIRAMIDDGIGDRVVMAHDICTKHRLVRYGGHGYGYILEHIVPRMRTRNFSESEIHSLVQGNPGRLLTIT